jgi:F-type H+-transporting ATPase subunit epsilon
MGELGIYPGHAPLLTTVKPGQVAVTLQDDNEELYYVSGGMLEIQPNYVTILADVAMRAQDIDEARALKAEEDARALLANKQGELDYSKALSELAEASAQVRAIAELKKKLKHTRR